MRLAGVRERERKLPSKHWTPRTSTTGPVHDFLNKNRDVSNPPSAYHETLVLPNPLQGFLSPKALPPRTHLLNNQEPGSSGRKACEIGAVRRVVPQMSGSG